MSNLLAGLIGALIGLGGVVAGAWLQGREEHQRWLRDQKLHAAIDYIGATADLYDLACHGIANAMSPSDSCLLLANGDRLAVTDIARLRLHDADLAFLSACSTA